MELNARPTVQDNRWALALAALWAHCFCHRSLAPPLPYLTPAHTLAIPLTSLDEHRSLKREVDMLERKLAELRAGGGGQMAAAGAAAEGGETAAGMQAVGR